MKSNCIKKYSMAGNIFLVTTLLIFHISGCSEQSTNPDKGLNAFSLSVKVIDDNNNPMNGIEIGSYYHTSIPLPKETKTNNLSNPMAATNIRFSIMQECITNVEAYDLENVLVKKIIENQPMQAGYYSVIFNAEGLKGSVYKVRLVVRDTTNQNILFTDSIYTALLHLDPVPCKMGITSGSGNFITNDKTYFPSIYTLPDLIRTGENDPTPLGIFTITNEITIQLTDTLANVTKIFNKTISKGKNEFLLKFTEGNKSIYNITETDGINKTSNIKSIIPKVKIDWNLEQSYPNPFN